jgi:hypothetical protein
MDLDEALHARDARQILRLIKAYNLEKAQLLRQEAARKKDKQREISTEQSQIEQDRKQKIRDAQIDYERKKQEIALNDAREREEAQRDYDRKRADLQRHLDEKMKTLGRHLVQEYNLTLDGAKAVYMALKAYYGENGYMQQLFTWYAAMKEAILNQPVGTTPTATNQGYIVAPGTTTITPQTVPGGFAEGGTILANRPTKILFGENGLEMARITPLGKTGKDVNKLFGSLSSGSGGIGGDLKLRIALSDGLIAEIVDTSLYNVSSVIETAVRERR